ncbi:MAG: type II toxin-antitoxin system HicB family antitoxin [Acidimicrobiia bacterium]
MSTARTYTANAIRSGNWWAIEVPELEGVFTQARRLDQVEGMARDAIAGVLDVDPDSFDVVVRPQLPTEWQEHLAQLESIRAAAGTLASMVSVKMRETARLLHDSQGLPLREVGAVLGVSHQRIHQVLSEDMAATPDIYSLFLQCVKPSMVEKVREELHA